MELDKLLREYNIDFASEGHKHCQVGWINMPCPFCKSEPGHEGLHLGYNLSGEYFYCWRCGGHPTYKVLSKLLNVPELAPPVFNSTC